MKDHPHRGTPQWAQFRRGWPTGRTTGRTATPQWVSATNYCSIAIPILVAQNGGTVSATDAISELRDKFNCSNDTVGRGFKLAATEYGLEKSGRGRHAKWRVRGILEPQVRTKGREDNCARGVDREDGERDRLEGDR